MHRWNKKSIISCICIITVLVVAAIIISTVVIQSNLNNRSEAKGNDNGAAIQNSSIHSQGISLERAKSIALEDAELSEEDITFTKAELENDRLDQTYIIEFNTSDTEYEYKINAANGRIQEKSIEIYRIPPDSSQQE